LSQIQSCRTRRRNVAAVLKNDGLAKAVNNIILFTFPFEAFDRKNVNVTLLTFHRQNHSEPERESCRQPLRKPRSILKNGRHHRTMDSNISFALRRAAVSIRVQACDNGSGLGWLVSPMYAAMRIWPVGTSAVYLLDRCHRGGTPFTGFWQRRSQVDLTQRSTNGAVTSVRRPSSIPSFARIRNGCYWICFL
jgi:hypothetical protein